MEVRADGGRCAPFLVALGVAMTLFGAQVYGEEEEIEDEAASKEHEPTSGHDGHFFLASEDGDFRLEIQGQLQARYIHGRTDRQDGASENEEGFQIRRGKIAFVGHLYGPKIGFKLQGAFDRGGGDFRLDEGYVTYRIGRHYLAAGQMHSRFLRESWLSSKRQQAADRTHVNSFFRVEKPQGVQIGGTYPRWRWSAMIHDGRESSNLDFDDDLTKAALTGRIETRVGGGWRQFRDFAAWAGEEPGLLLGAAFDYEIAEPGEDLPFDDFWQWTLDLSYESHPWNLFLAAVARSVDGTGGAPSIDQLGLVAQAGVLVRSDKMDLFARWEELDHDGFEEVKRAPSAIAPELEDRVRIYTVGANYYHRKHALKSTLDVAWAPDGVRQGESSLGTVDSPTNEGQITVRAQLQLVF